MGLKVREGVSDQAKESRIAICFFGITRSLSYTIDSIRLNVLEPARRCGETRLFAHLFRQSRIDNPRSGESGSLDVDEYQLLAADHVELEDPYLCLESMNYKEHVQRPDPWDDDYRSFRNFLHQLHSLDRVGSLALEWGPDVYVFVRPDLRYLDSFEPFISQALRAKQPTVFYPNWQHHGGMNDRFAVIAGAEAARVYSKRGAFIWDFAEKFGGVFNGERLLKYATLRTGIKIRPIYARAERIRSNGVSRRESFRRPKSLISKTLIRFLLQNVMQSYFH